MATRISKKDWGVLHGGRTAHLFQIENDNGIQIIVSDYGGIIQSIITPDKYGNLDDIVLGYDTLDEYINDDCYFGATVGRCANRIAGASFVLNGREYRLTANENENTLHGGNGFNKKLWDYNMEGDELVLSYLSPDGESGFPGNLHVTLFMTLSDEGTFRMTYLAESDADTICNLTGHSYFNLSGVRNSCSESTGNVANHHLKICANVYTPVDSSVLPTGEISPVEGTIYDFRDMRPVGNESLDCNLGLNLAGTDSFSLPHDLAGADPFGLSHDLAGTDSFALSHFASEHYESAYTKSKCSIPANTELAHLADENDESTRNESKIKEIGYNEAVRAVETDSDESNCLESLGNNQRKAIKNACVYEKDSGRMLTVSSSLPGVQLYNGGFITPRKGKNGVQYYPHSGLCLEPQFFPDAIHHPEFEQPILRKGEKYEHSIEYRFSCI